MPQKAPMPPRPSSPIPPGPPPRRSDTRAREVPRQDGCHRSDPRTPESRGRLAIPKKAPMRPRPSSPIPPGPPPRRSDNHAREAPRQDRCHRSDPRTPESRGRLATPSRPIRSRKRARSASPPGPPRLRSISPSGPPRRKRSRGAAGGEGGQPVLRTTAAPQKALLMGWLKDGAAPICARLAPDASGYVVLAEHKVELGEVELKQQHALEKYGLQDDGSMGWQPLPWDTPVYAEAGRVILIRYAGVKDLHKWDAYAPHITV